MLLNFTKMHGLGNDFVVLDSISQSITLTPELVQRLADRHEGIGFDQLLLVEPPSLPDVDFDYRIFNANGGEVEQCGNGIRCFARFVLDKGLTNKHRISVATRTGVAIVNVEKDGQVTVNMGAPQLTPAKIPFIADHQQATYEIDSGDNLVTASAISVGNPHVVICVDDIASAPVDKLGPILESHPRFPNRVNVGFMQVIRRNYIKLRVYERGVGETRACGTGACAAVVAGRLQDRLDHRVKVELPGGSLRIRWKGGDNPVWMTGPTTTVYTGQITV